MKLCHLVITTGTTKGVGLEVVLNSIRGLEPRPNTRISLLIPKSEEAVNLTHQWKVSPTKLSRLGHWTSKKANEIQLVRTSLSASRVVERATKFCLADPHSAMVNAPMRKTPDGGGHTEIIKRLSQVDDLKMAFVGKRFHICLATTHIPIDQVYRKLSSTAVLNTLKASLKLREITNSRGAIGLLGLNPHAGENGAISNQDQRLMEVIKSKGLANEFTKMLSPDGAFIGGPPSQTVLAWYHDQGLIPFKALHGLSKGIQVTLGIPFIRTSVDHGTAEDLYGQGIADHRSMKMAIESARKFQLKFGNTLF